MKKSKTLGRYDSPEYIEPIKKQFEENFPNNVPKDFIIDHAIKYFWRYVEEQLKQDKEVSIFSFGKFHVKSGVSPRTKQFQYYPKFKFSRHFTLRLRDEKGTTTEAEKKEIETKREFMKNIWSQRKAHILEQRGKLPAKLQDTTDTNS